MASPGTSKSKAIPRAVDMAYEIKLAMAEHARGDISVEVFRERLRQIVATEVRVARAGSA